MTEPNQSLTKSLEEFYTLLLKDYRLQERLKAAIDPKSFVELAVELGKEVGCCFTEDDVLAAIAEGGECVVLSGGDVFAQSCIGTACECSQPEPGSCRQQCYCS